MRISLRRLSILKALPAVVASASLAGCARQCVTPPARPAVQVPAANAAAKKPDPPATAAYTGPRLELSQKTVTLRWIEKGLLRMSVTASEFNGDEVTRTGSLLDFSAKLYENGKLTAEMSAPKAVADTTNRIVTATGGVSLRSVERKTSIKAGWMRWFARENRVVGSGGVSIESTMGTVEAAAFEADTALKTISVKDTTKGIKL